MVARRLGRAGAAGGARCSGLTGKPVPGIRMRRADENRVERVPPSGHGTHSVRAEPSVMEARAGTTGSVLDLSGRLPGPANDAVGDGKTVPGSSLNPAGRLKCFYFSKEILLQFSSLPVQVEKERKM